MSNYPESGNYPIACPACPYRVFAQRMRVRGT